MWIFIGRNVEARASQAGLHKPKKDTASAKEGKVRSPCRGGRRLKAVLLIRRKTCPRVSTACNDITSGVPRNLPILLWVEYISVEVGIEK